MIKYLKLPYKTLIKMKSLKSSRGGLMYDYLPALESRDTNFYITLENGKFTGWLCNEKTCSLCHYYPCDKFKEIANSRPLYSHKIGKYYD